ncbi:MAG: PIN domain-containing protein [Thermomicrobiales bacterium]|nr:PIN domain-containing protein [Thermomicrobiales bacterium]
MIFLDTNFILRYLNKPTTPATEEMNRIAFELLTLVEAGEQDVTTTEVVLHEICYVMRSDKHEKKSTQEIVDLVRSLISLEGFRFERDEKQLFLRALEIYEANPKLEYSDSVVAARVEALGIPLATFDKRLGKLPTVTRWVPESAGTSD